ncbi:hypothetical protein HRbin02_00583 [Candidatus Calditenuaceae archaeon HR02]|nr:hypothetical protein HRbin02_00583 [Candidatus Calditenuaceae archaeon HR02]
MARYANTIYVRVKRGCFKNPKYVNIVNSSARREALKRIQSEALKDIRRLWREHFGCEEASPAGRRP